MKNSNNNKVYFSRMNTSKKTKNIIIKMFCKVTNWLMVDRCNVGT